MIPNNDDLINDFEIEESPSLTFGLTDRNTISGTVDGLEAVKQAIHLILNTERYEHLIFSWDYGIELVDLIGKPPSYVLPEIKRRITEALEVDTRITGVGDFQFETVKNKVNVRFTVNTIFGEIEEGIGVAV